MTQAIDLIYKQLNTRYTSPKFSGVFGQAQNRITIQGAGGWRFASYKPTASAFIKELKSLGNKDIQFVINKNNNATNLGTFGYTPYIFTAVLTTNLNLEQARTSFQQYFAYYFNNVSLYIQAVNLNLGNVNASGSVNQIEVEVILPSGNALTFNITALQKTLLSKGFKNPTVSRQLPNTIIARFYGDANNALTQSAETQIRNLILQMDRQTPSVTQSITNSLPNIDTVQAQAILNAAIANAKATGKTVNESLSEMTNGAINSAKDIGKAVNNGFSFDSILESDFVKKLSLSLGIGAGVTLLLLFAGGALFLKIYTGK